MGLPSTLSCFLLFVLLLVDSGACDCGPWVAVHPSILYPQFLNDDEIEVRYLVAPLLECDYGNDFSYLNLYHGGLAFVNKRTSFNFTINFDAYPTFPGAFFPKFKNYPNGTTEMVWQNFGKTFIYLGLNQTYWTINQNVASINGTGLKKFIDWIAKSNDTLELKYYNPWNLYSHWPKGSELISSFECFDYVWKAFDVLDELDAKFNLNTKAKISITTLYGKTPKKVDTNDPKEYAKLVRFYQTMEFKVKKEGILAFLRDLEQIVIEGYFYIRVNDEYYFVQLHDFPYFGFHFVQRALPHQTISNEFEPGPFRQALAFFFALFFTFFSIKLLFVNPEK